MQPHGPRTLPNVAALPHPWCYQEFRVRQALVLPSSSCQVAVDSCDRAADLALEHVSNHEILGVIGAVLATSIPVDSLHHIEPAQLGIVATDALAFNDRMRVVAIKAPHDDRDVGQPSGQRCIPAGDDFHAREDSQSGAGPRCIDCIAHASTESVRHLGLVGDGNRAALKPGGGDSPAFLDCTQDSDDHLVRQVEEPVATGNRRIKQLAIHRLGGRRGLPGSRLRVRERPSSGVALLA